MKYYDLTYLISPEVSEKDAQDLSQNIVNFLQKEGKFLESVKTPSKIKLAYPVKKKDKAYLSFLNFFLEPGKIGNLKKKLDSENNILRFLISSKEPPRVEVPKRIPKTPRKPVRKKVELKEIEKKLEEILK